MVIRTMLLESILYRERGYRNHEQVCIDHVLGDLICLKEDEHFVEGTESDLIPPLAVSFSKVSPYKLALADEDGCVVIYDTTKFGIDSLKADWLAHKNAIFDLDWVPHCNQLVTASGDQTVALWDVEKEEKIASFRGHSSSVKTVRFHEEEQFVFASGARDGSIMMWDTRVNAKNDYWEPINMLRHGHMPNTTQPRSACKRRKADSQEVVQQSITSVIYRENHQLISASSIDGAVKIWDTRKTYTNNKTPLAFHTFPFAGSSSRTHGFTSLILDPTKTRLFASCMDHTIYQYDCAAFTNKPVSTYRGHQMGTFYVKLSISPDGRYLLSGSSDNYAYIWNTMQSSSFDSIYAAPLKLSGHQGEVSDVTWCPTDPLQLVTSSDDGTVRIWRTITEGLKNAYFNQMGRIVGKAEWTKKNVGTSAMIRTRSKTAKIAIQQRANNPLASPIKGTTLPTASPPKVSPAVKQSLANMASCSSPKLLEWKHKSPLKSPQFQSPFKSPSLQSPFKSPFTSPRKLIITPKKSPADGCMSGIKALQDSTSKMQNVEQAKGVKRKLCDMTSPSPDIKTLKKACMYSSPNRSDSSVSARKSLFGGHKQATSTSSASPKTRLSCLRMSHSPRKSPGSRIFSSPTVDLPNYVFDPQPRTPIGKKMEEKVRTPDWLTQISHNKNRNQTENENNLRSSPRTPRQQRLNISDKNYKSSSPSTPRHNKLNLRTSTTPTSSRRQSTPKTAPKRLSSNAMQKTPTQRNSKSSILQYFSPQSSRT